MLKKHFVNSEWLSEIVPDSLGGLTFQHGELVLDRKHKGLSLPSLPNIQANINPQATYNVAHDMKAMPLRRVWMAPRVKSTVSSSMASPPV